MPQISEAREKSVDTVLPTLYNTSPKCRNDNLHLAKLVHNECCDSQQGLGKLQGCMWLRRLAAHHAIGTVKHYAILDQ